MNATPPTSPETTRGVAVLDLSDMRHADIEVRRRLGKRMAELCRRVGFFYISNHGISEGTIARMFEIGREFFDLTPAVKNAMSMANSLHYRGYLPMKMLGNDAEMKGNLLESFHVWQEHAADDPDLLAGKPLHGLNQWPAEMPGIQREVLEYTEQVTALAIDMCKLAALGLDLPEETFASQFDRPLSLLRFIHYPPQEGNGEDGRFGTRPHTDNGAFTLLAQDDTGGLEIMGEDGQWMAVPPISGTFVINLGEIMKVWTKGLFLATPHRVINKYGKERYSLPFFLNPNYDSVIAPMLSDVDGRVAPVFHTSVDFDEHVTTGEILTRLYRRIWPSAHEQQVK